MHLFSLVPIIMFSQSSIMISPQYDLLTDHRPTLVIANLRQMEFPRTICYPWVSDSGVCAASNKSLSPGGGGGGGYLGPGGEGLTWVLNGYPLPKGHPERKRWSSKFRGGQLLFWQNEGSTTNWEHIVGALTYNFYPHIEGWWPPPSFTLKMGD